MCLPARATSVHTEIAKSSVIARIIPGFFIVNVLSGLLFDIDE